ncbi:FAD-dependent oxidoreductase [Mycoplasma iguanae]|uniref:FAD-dependent oxidoreductase n=1 Tax=Mycoplasma iguanae TaxID=292461 RepID=A0ABY5R844_9MOLU|nr:FAD-dependent oxidoreductase [Mycoplasma iguanae]UVD81451.1 FAD-dependent oxidoreductase [Mycoplasma iguanae]
MRIISIGANHAGTSFLRTLSKLSKEHEIVAYDSNTDISFLGCGIALWVGGEFEEPSGLFYSNVEELKSLGIDVKLQHKVISLDHKNKTVVVKNLVTGEEFQDKYDKLVFAGGTWPIVPPFEGVQLKNILLSKTFTHAKEIKKQALNPEVKEVVVIGAGYIGIELVEAFHKYNKKVTLVDMQERIIPNYFDEEFTTKVEQKMVQEGIKLQLGEKVVKFNSEDGEHVSSVVTDKGEYKAQLVILAIGFKPNTELLEGFDKLKNGAVKVDQFQRTLTDKDVYAIGDSAALRHNSIEDYAHVALATNAVKTGIVTAFHVSGKELPFPGVQGTNAIHVFGFNYASTGFSVHGCQQNPELQNVEAASYVEDWDRNEFMQEKYRVWFKLTYDKNTLRILGAQIGSEGVSHTEVMYALSLAIQQKLTLPDLALMDYYFLPHYNKPFNFIITSALNALGLKY